MDEDMTDDDLVDWMEHMFNLLSMGYLWDDLTPKSRDNEFNWERNNA